jgi:type II secretory pathway pseudopilin PulG
MKHRRGLTLLELLLSTAITVLVGAAIVAMLGAVNSGVGTRHDMRTVMARAAAARTRVDAYLAASRCVLALSGSNLTIWLDDNRKSDTVHATEIRWLKFDSGTGTLKVYYVEFPSGWTQTAMNLEDMEYPANTDWGQVLKYYQTKNEIVTMSLVDGVSSLSINADQNNPKNVQHLSVEFGFTTDGAPMVVSVPTTIIAHQTPKS